MALLWAGCEQAVEPDNGGQEPSGEEQKPGGDPSEEPSEEAWPAEELAALYKEIEIEDFEFCSGGNENARLEYFTGYGAPRKLEDDFAENGKYIDGNMGGDWIRYDLILRANRLIAVLQETSGDYSAATMLAEARIIRAWFYCSMAKRYGGMPIVTEEEMDENGTPRSSEKEIWDFIINELDAAAGDLPSSAASKTTFNRYTALALKARAALYAASIAKYSSGLENIGSYTDGQGTQVCGIPAAEAEGYYQMAFDAAAEIISSGEYSLARDLADNGADSYAMLFQKPTAHNESMFIKDYPALGLTHSWDYYHLPDILFERTLGEPRYDNPTLQLVNMYDNLDGTSAAIDLALGWSDAVSSADAWFRDRDYRLGGTVYYPGCHFPWDESGMLWIYRGILREDGWVGVEPGWININGTDYYSRGTYGMGDDTDTPTGFLCRKYVDESSLTPAADRSRQSWIEMRYAEILLIAAEAAAELGTDSGNIGLAAINDIRTRAGLPEAAALELDDVRKQWVCEMAFENRIFWCMRRWRTLGQSLTGDYMPRAIAPYYGPEYSSGRIYKYSTEDAAKYNRNGFETKFYYNEISEAAMSENALITQNYGY